MNLFEEMAADWWAKTGKSPVGRDPRSLSFIFGKSHYEMLIAKTVNGAPARSFKQPKLSLPKNTLAKHPTNGRCFHPMAIPNQPKLIADEIFRNFVMRLITLIDCWFDFRIDHKTLGILMISCLHRIRNRTAPMHPNRKCRQCQGCLFRPLIVRRTTFPHFIDAQNHVN